MGKILQPLQNAGLSGIFMTSGDGLTWWNHPLFTCFIGDYPKQILVTCVPTGKCPTCPKPCDELGEYDPDEAPRFQDLEQVLTALDSFKTDPGGFLQTCAEARIKPVVDPFWKDLSYTHIHCSITPDILHQLYQGVLKHLISWVTAACGVEEIDTWCHRMPPNHNVHHFLKGERLLSLYEFGNVILDKITMWQEMRLALLILKGPKGFVLVDVDSSDTINCFDCNHK